MFILWKQLKTVSKCGSTLGKYTLIVTEKPDAAVRIAAALDYAGKPKRMQEKGVPYYEAKRDAKIVVVPALGHLYTVTGEAKERGRYPVFGLRWVPKYEVERGATRIRTWLQVISKLAKEADLLIDACDYDIEGSIIGYCILRYACQNRENTAKRMKYSILTQEELEKAYMAPLPHLDFGLIEAGLSRHEIDWLYGINLSRALTYAAKSTSGHYTTLSTGRVQGPALKFLAARERSIECFVPVPYWSIKAKVKIGSAIFEAAHEKKTFEVKQEAQSTVDACKQKFGAITGIEAKQFIKPPPVPFDLGTLQSEAYKLFGYTPMRTLSTAQRLYLDALISYPRTSSQKLPPQIGYENILKNLAKMREYTKLAGELLSKLQLRPNEGKKDDSAHPAIYPTGKLPQKQLIGPEKNIYNLVVYRFMAVFGEPALRQSVKAALEIGGEKFLLNGKQTLDEGWLRFYKPFARLQDTPLPAVTRRQVVKIEKVILEDKFTKPPPRYNPSSLLKKMEQENIGTKATRAGIIETLYDRKYIHGEKIAVSDLGFEVTDVLRKYCPEVVSAEFTQKLEERMSQVQQRNESKEKILADAIEVLKTITTNLKNNEKAVGQQLSQALNRAKQEEREIGPCPTCQNGKLFILYSKKIQKRFVGCTNYFKGTCKTAFPLPQMGFVKPSGKTCKSCNWHTVLVWRKGKYPQALCLNSKCASKEEEEKA
jgi:DNA topoisomerase I